ncbi:putative ribonuclease H-like domain-containing protein [Tanacetum coccineum]
MLEENQRSGRNQGRRSYGDNGRSNAPTNESSSQALVAQDGLGGYDWSNDFEVEPVNYALMAISSSSSSSSSDSEVQKCSKQCLESFKTLQKNYDTEREKHNKAKLEIRGYEIALESLESRILGHEKNELAWGEKYEFQNYELKCREIKINNLNLELEKVVKERDELKDKIAKWEESTKNLNEILNSQMSARDKTGLGYSTQLNELSSNHETDSENSLSIFDVRSSDEENTSENDRFSKNRYKAVPPPIIGNFLTPRADISFVGQTNAKKPKSASESVVSNLKINKDRVIIEDWNSDDEDEEFEVQTVRPETQTVKTRDEKSGQNSKKQGIGFRKVKACFVCKSTDYLIKDCNFHDKKSQEHKLKNVVNIGQREGKPVWDNTKRINHQNFSKYPHLSNTFIPLGVLTRTGLHRPSVSTARPNVSTARPSVSTARPVCTAKPNVSTARPVYATRPIYPRMDNVRPRGSCSPIKRSYYTKPAFRPKDLKQDVKTFGVQNMTTAGTRAVVNTGKGKLDTDLKKSRWVWRPKGNYLDHVSKDSGSFMLKKGNPEILLQDHAVVDSGCSSHMTGNKAYLSDYEDFNGGFVAFGSDPKGGKITGKGKIKTANLDFDDVYFVDELKFNLFSVSQMCDKKNSVLFTESECLILSPSFKLLDESQVVLRAPRKDDVYSLDLKNIVPSGGITCLYANATADESKLWHRRLGHVNFKNINKLVKGHLVRGLPSKVFVNDHTCVACKKGKQHKASCKAKLERIIRKPLELLHMDLFGPVSVESINKKRYCLVVTDDFSRFSWVFFLATKDETSEILYYEDFNGGFVAFGSDPKGGKITGKGKIKTANLDFDDVYFVDELKFNLFSVSQMCDKKNSVLFTESECLILSPSFKLLDESQVVLRAPRKDDVYSLDLKNIVPSGGITCLYANATADESKLWHRRLGHVNFKNINKLVKGHLVRGLPSKVFVNDHTCVACKKGKQHKASCKAKLERIIRKPLELLHMDLFGPVSVESINKKRYCLVVTDDFSRFSWVFFLATKDETSEILCNLIIGLEKQLNHNVKIIRCDNGTEFKNYDINEFCAKKGIKREFSVAKTPQQNGVAERKNRTLIEAARTMLADSLLPIPFWAEAVNTACYVLNRVLVTKPQNKTPYELLIGKLPSISFMRPFGYSLTILNTLDFLGKFDGKSDEGYLLGYSTSSKAFRVYNKRTKRVEENLHINFIEDQPNVAGTGLNWMFDLDFLTNSMNYIPVSVENQVNVDASTQDSYVAGSSGKDKRPTQEYILLPLQPHRTRIPVKDVVQVAQEKPSENAFLDKDIQDSEDAADKEEQH